MNVYTIYNFDIIFDEDVSNSEERLSISRGGNKELYYSIREIFLQTRMQFGEFANAGYISLLNYFDGIIPEIKYNNNEYQPPKDYLSLNYQVKDKPNINKTKNVKIKFEEIMALLHPVEQILEKPELYNLDYSYNLLETYENEFANEISAFYYFNRLC